MSSGLRVAVVGATGAVGKEMMSVLEARKFPVREMIPFASARSVGREIPLLGGRYKCQELKKGCFDGIDIAFFDASDAISREWVPAATEAGAWVVDNSATFRMEEDVPLVVPEVNASALESRLKKGVKNLSPRERIIAGPNCTTVQLVVALKPLRDQWGIRRVVVSTYQSTSGAGAAAMDELKIQIQDYLGGREVHPQSFTHQIAFNCIPHIGGFKPDGYTSEEHKIMAETRKILSMSQLKITATSVRVPTLSCHGESVSVECEKPFELEEVRAALRAQSGIVVQDDPSNNQYPMMMPGARSFVEAATGRDSVYVGRLRKDFSCENGLNLWIVSDNLRKGAALNAVQIGEILYG